VEKPTFESDKVQGNFGALLDIPETKKRWGKCEDVREKERRIG